MKVGFIFFVLGGMMSLAVKSKTKDTVKCNVVDGGELKSRRHLNVRGKSATLPSITGQLLDTTSRVLPLFLVFWFCDLAKITFYVTDKDWEDIKFGVDNQIDFYAVSFVKDAQVVHQLKDYLRSMFPNLHLLPFV